MDGKQCPCADMCSLQNDLDRLLDAIDLDSDIDIDDECECGECVSCVVAELKGE